MKNDEHSGKRAGNPDNSRPFKRGVFYHPEYQNSAVRHQLSTKTEVESGKSMQETGPEMNWTIIVHEFIFVTCGLIVLHFGLGQPLHWGFGREFSLMVAIILISYRYPKPGGGGGD